MGSVKVRDGKEEKGRNVNVKGETSYYLQKDKMKRKV